METAFWLFIIGVLGSIIAWLLKRIMDTVDNMVEDVRDMKPKVTELWDMREDIRDIKPKVDALWGMKEDIRDMKPKVDALWEEVFSSAKSPKQLNDRGVDILNQSGIKEIIEDNRGRLFALVQEEHPQNSYDAERIIESVVSNLPTHCPDLVPELKQGAFESGIHVNALLFVGGLHLRNMIFDDLGFKLDDLDKSTNTKK